MARPTSNLRMFVAAYPPQSLVQRWHEQLAGLRLPSHRLTPLDQVHLTLLFIGDTPAKEMPRVTESAQRAAAGLAAFSLSPQSLISLPQSSPSQPVRLVAVETDAPPTLLELQRRLANRLARKTSNRRYLPHLTLCRFTPPTLIEPLNLPASGDAFTITDFALMRSTLTPKGSHHELVKRITLA